MNYRHAFHAGNFADVRQARGAGPHSGASARQAGGVPRHRHPCRRRPLRSRRPGGEPQPRMARGHRAAASPRSIGEQARALLAPYLDAIAAFNGARRPHQLSRLARARARVSARAGSAARLRARAERGGRAGALSGRRPAQQGAGDRRLDRASTPMCRPRSGAASCSSIRPFEDAGDFARLGAGARSGAPQMGRAAPICCGIRSRSARGRTLLRAACGAAASQRFCAPNSASARTRADNRLGACGLDRRQSAVDARRRACDPAAGACGDPLGRWRRRPPRRLAGKRKVVSPLFHSPGLAYFHGCWL